MCLAYPMKIIEIKADKAVAEAEGITREIGTGLIKKLKIGDYVMVHAGFAIEKVDPNQAIRTLDVLKEYRDALRKGFTQ